MIWAKRRFAWADYGPYQDRLAELMMANPLLYKQFIMVCTDTDDVGVSDYYIGLPHQAFLAFFDGFATVTEQELPNEIDTLLVADHTTDEFTSRFRFRDPLSRRRKRHRDVG
jgi:hypothetical protein